jgi:hypothetical protein
VPDLLSFDPLVLQGACLREEAALAKALVAELHRRIGAEKALAEALEQAQARAPGGESGGGSGGGGVAEARALAAEAALAKALAEHEASAATALEAQRVTEDGHRKRVQVRT